MPFDLPLYWALLKKVFNLWLDDDVPCMGAALATMERLWSPLFGG
ncbi:hypothetical protein [Rhodoferax sp.]|nr:hypothetical protein [Rhodoferax sp.]MDD2919463.1 hypothetical protein [Rhodoferax sp.]